MRLPFLTSLYGRIFAIFWLTLLVVLIAVISLPEWDPRRSHDIPPHVMSRLYDMKEEIEEHYADADNLHHVIMMLDRFLQRERHGEMRFRTFIVDAQGQVLNQRVDEDIKSRALQNFITSNEASDKPQQRLYGKYLFAGPIPVTLAKQELSLFVMMKGVPPAPFVMRLFDTPFTLLLVLMLVSTPFLLWLAWALSKPAQRLEQAAKRVARGEFSVDKRLESGPREFQQAGKSFNQMVEAVNGMITGQQRLLSDISHELRSPLTRLRMANALATRKQGESPELERIDTEAQRLESMISDLLSLSRMQVDSHTQLEVQPLESLWLSILEDAQFEAEQIGKALHYETIPNRSIKGNPKLLMSAFENIVRNALCYGNQQIQVSFNTDKYHINLRVEDDGPGVPESDLEAIFRPFYRVSTARDRHSGGTGLGLAITESAVRQHSGTIKASVSPLGGLQIDIQLPLVV